MTDRMHASALSEEELMSEFCSCLQRAGVPISRMTIIIPALHPQVFATVLVWREDAGAKTIHESHDILHTPRFKDSPFALILRGAGGVRRRIERPETKLDFPVVRDLKVENATDYVAMPFRFSDGQMNVMSMTSFAAGGFSTDHLGRVFEVLPGLARFFEVFAQRRTAMTLLMYARRKGWPLESAVVRLRHGRDYADDDAHCDTRPARVDHIDRTIELAGPLTTTQRARLLEIADKCPVHRTLDAGVRIGTAEG